MLIILNPEGPLIGRHFWSEPLQGNESGTVVALFQERNVCQFERVGIGSFAPSPLPLAPSPSALPLDGLLVHCRAIPGLKFSNTLLYTWLKEAL